MSPSPTFCNPLNLSYRFQVKGWAQDCLREAADPSVVWFNNAYWLFASKSGGYWRSVDLQEWTFIPTRILPTEDYAPDVRVINGELYFTASAHVPCPIFKTTDPGHDAWTKVSTPLTYWDPHMFQDDDGRIYFYWGCSNSQPIRGVEMACDLSEPIGEPVDLFSGVPRDHGWERGQENNWGGQAPYIEGPWMNKIDGRYYLQYAGPGTEWNVYGDGVYIASAPLGPYRYAAHNPFSFKPGGFITGAGHGSTFADEYGNLWHAATMRISVKHAFERRLGLFPAGLDDAGNLACNTAFGDYPMRLPQGRWDPWVDSFCGWMLLSYRKPASASSTQEGFPASLALNEDIRNYWSAATKEPDEWLQVDLENDCIVHAIQINFAEHDCLHYARGDENLAHRYLVEVSNDGAQWQIARDRRADGIDSPHEFLTFHPPLRTRYVKLTCTNMPANGYAAVSGFRIFGLSPVNKPAMVTDIRPVLDRENLSLQLEWSSIPESDGYNVRWGLSPEKLYNSWLLYDQVRLDLRAINRGSSVWVRIDAFNGAGVTEGIPFNCIPEFTSTSS